MMIPAESTDLENMTESVKKITTDLKNSELGTTSESHVLFFINVLAPVFGIFGMLLRVLRPSSGIHRPASLVRRPASSDLYGA